MTTMKDGGALTLTVPVDDEVVDRALVRLPLRIVPLLTQVVMEWDVP